MNAPTRKIESAFSPREIRAKRQTEIKRRIAQENREPIDAMIRAIGALGELLNTGNSHAEELALDAHMEGRPAYWSSYPYHNQAAIKLVEEANRSNLTDALAQIARPAPRAANADYLLGTLIPLNIKARNELEKVREAHFGEGR